MHARNDAHLLPADREATLRELRKQTPDQLIAGIKTDLGLSAEAFECAALRIQVLDEMGYDLDSLKLTMLPYLRRIAQGMLHSAALCRLYGVRHVLLPFSHLPLADQHKLLDQGVVIGTKDETGHIREAKPKPVESLTKAEAERVFDPIGVCRTPVQQVAWQREQEQANFVPEGLPFRRAKDVLLIIRAFRMTKKDWQMIGKFMGWL